MFDEYDYPDDGHIVFAMDQFIGEPECWNKGIGSSFLKMMAAYLKENMAAERVLLDPHQNNSRAKTYDWTGKKVYAFATSGGSGIGKTAEKLQPYVNGASEVDAKLVSSVADIKDWK